MATSDLVSSMAVMLLHVDSDWRMSVGLLVGTRQLGGCQLSDHSGFMDSSRHGISVKLKQRPFSSHFLLPSWSHPERTQI